MTRLPNPRLDIEYFDNETTNFGPAARAGVIHDAANIGWAWYSRFPGAAFWTLKRLSEHNGRIVPGLTHVRIWYTNEATGYGPVLVFTGRVGDPDESADDVVWTAYSYLAELALSRTGYRVMYEREEIATIVEKEWERHTPDKPKFANYGARRQVKGLLRHVKTGVIQNPLNATSGQMKTEPQFGVISVPRLLLFFDLSEIGRANTQNNVTYQITRDLDPTFHFYRNKGGQRTSLRLMFPGNTNDFRYSKGILNIRNDIATIGTKDGKAKFLQAERAGGPYGFDLFGRRQDTFTIKTLSGFKNLGTDEGQFSAQKMITERAVKEATRPVRQIQFGIANMRTPFGVDPFDGWDIEDELYCEWQDRSGPPSARWMRVVGVRGRLGDDGYRQSIILQEPVS
jgi:hypothetical protein